MKCIILAGGSGERLWPLSRATSPKLLLNLYGDKTLLQNTYKTALTLTQSKNILVVTNIKQETDVKLQLKSFDNSINIISEPMTKNTTAAIASSLIYLQKKRDEIVVILPSDFYIKDNEKFVKAIEEAKNIAKDGYICTIGVKPRYTEENLGYIELGEEIKNGFKISKFVEKPSKENADKYTKNSNWFWNTGIYVAKLSVLLNAIEKYAPDSMQNFSINMFDENNKIKFEYYENLPEISIDYAVMEKAEKMACVELKTNWLDMGSWLSLYEHGEKDKNGNLIKGNVIVDKVKNSFVYSSKELIALSNIKDVVVVETEDAVLVADNTQIDKIRDIVTTLKTKEKEITQTHKTVFRPWGFYTCLQGGEGWLTKIITVSPNHKLSLQSHNHRSEHWVVLEGEATVVLEDNIHILQKSQSIDIPIKAKHSLQNHTNKIVKILELQKGDYISEDDIIRYEDMYGRIK